MTRIFSALPAAVRGICWVLLQTASYSALATCVRALARDMEAFEVVAFRSGLGLLALAPWLFRTGAKAVVLPEWKRVNLRNILAFIAFSMSIVGLARLPVSDVSALQFTTPIFIVIGAGLILGEKVGIRRWSATLVGFLGVLVIVRPGFVEVNNGVTITLVSAALFGLFSS